MRHTSRALVGLALAVWLAGTLALAGGGRRRPPAALALPESVTAQESFSILLGRPTGTGITVSLLSARGGEGYVEYASGREAHPLRTPLTRLPAGVPVEVALAGLRPDTRYRYRVYTRETAEAPFSASPEQTFHTSRARGSSFTFALQGDSHPERSQQHDPALYAHTLLAAAADRPDFYLTLGDDFSVDTLRNVTAEAVRAVYLRQRAFLSLVGQSAPLFLVNGNHEQAALANLDGTPNNVAVWAQTSRNTLFPQPAPDAFHTGDAQPVDSVGLLRDYYARTWGDALFVVIDPYWHSPQAVDNAFGTRDKGGRGGRRDLWGITLGDAQYQWLTRTLENSHARYKFVFTHHVLGTGRGGIEEAGLYEWGGLDRNGADLFAAKRPGWTRPLHQLLASTGVTIFFQGHDHLFARQQLDGVVYQTVPEPADPNGTLYNAQAYRSGDVLPNSGYLRVTVAPDQATVEYVRESPGHRGEVAFRYAVPARTR